MKNERGSAPENNTADKETKEQKLTRQIFDRCSELFANGLETFPEKKTHQGREVAVFAFTFNFGETEPKSIWILGDKKVDYSINNAPISEDYRSFEIRFSPVEDDHLDIASYDLSDSGIRFRIFNFNKLKTDIYTYPRYYEIKPTIYLMKRVLKDLERNVTGIRARMETKSDLEAILDFLAEVKEGKEKPRALIDSKYEETRLPK